MARLFILKRNDWAHKGARLSRYSWAAVGPVSVAGCQFILSLHLLHILQPGEFGTFAFLMVMSQLSAGVWSALFCAPLPVLYAEADTSQQLPMVRCLFATNLACAGLAFAIFVLLGISLNVTPAAAALFAAYAALSLLRWYARAFAYTTGSSLKATISDIVFSVTLLGGVLVIGIYGASSLLYVYGAMVASVGVGLLTFGVEHLKRQFVCVSPSDLPAYASVWRRHSSWSLAGVVSTEATGNAHAYIVTFLAGPAAFAPVAASALIIRPIAVVMNALTDFERPQIAAHLGRSDFGSVRQAMVLFRLVLVAVWLSCVVGGIALLRLSPHLLFPPRYSIHYLVLGVVLWMLVAGTRLAKTPESVLLQGAGEFRYLAYASISSAGISIAAVFVLLWVAGPMWSIAGILIGEAVFTVIVRQRARRWLIKQSSGGGTGSIFDHADGGRPSSSPLGHGA